MTFQMSALESAAFLTAGAALWIGSAVAAPLPSSHQSDSGALLDSVMRAQVQMEAVACNWSW